MNQLIDPIPYRKSKQDDIQAYKEYARTATTDWERDMWIKAIDRTVNGARPFPEDLEPLYREFHNLWGDMTQSEIANKFKLRQWVLDDFMNRRRLNDSSVRRLRKINQQLNEDNE